VSKLAKASSFHGSGPVKYKLQGPPEAPTGATISIDYTNAPIPNHYYVTDYFEVKDLDPQVLFIFGKKTNVAGNERKLRSKLEIYFPAFFFIQQFWKSSRNFHEGLRKFAASNGYSSDIPSVISEEIEKTQTMHSNNLLMVQSGGECMMDFFYLSPRDFLLRTPKNLNVDLEALVRVIMSHTLLLGFLDSCEPIAETLSGKYGKEDALNEVVELD